MCAHLRDSTRPLQIGRLPRLADCRGGISCSRRAHVSNSTWPPRLHRVSACRTACVEWKMSFFFSFFASPFCLFSSFFWEARLSTVYLFLFAFLSLRTGDLRGHQEKQPAGCKPVYLIKESGANPETEKTRRNGEKRRSATRGWKKANTRKKRRARPNLSPRITGRSSQSGASPYRGRSCVSSVKTRWTI